MFLSWNVELALSWHSNVMASAAASSIMMGAAYTSCGCGIYVHHVIQSWIMQTCHVQSLLKHIMSCNALTLEAAQRNVRHRDDHDTLCS